MDLYVVRHAKAVDKADALDEHRPLTARGRRDALYVGKALRRAGVELQALVTSPLVRAVQTAELLACGLHFAEAIEVAPELVPNQTAQAVLERVVLPRAELRAIAIVGHEPQLGLILRMLVRQMVPSPRKAAAVRLHWDGAEGMARFEWVMQADREEPSTSIDDIG